MFYGLGFRLWIFEASFSSSKNLQSSKNRNIRRRTSIFEELSSSKNPSIFEEDILHLRKRASPFSKNFIFEEPSIFDLPARRSNKFHFDFRSRRSNNSLSSIFDVRFRRSKNPPIFDCRPRRIHRSNIGRKNGGFFEDGGVLRIWGFFDLRVRRTKNPPSSIFSSRRPKNPSHLPPSRSEERTKNPPGISSSDPLLWQPPAPLSYPEIWIFRPIFHLEDRSEDRDRPFTPRGTVVSWANRPVGVRSCLVRPRPAAPLCAAPNRSARGMFGLWIRQVYTDTQDADM